MGGFLVCGEHIVNESSHSVCQPAHNVYPVCLNAHFRIQPQKIDKGLGIPEWMELDLVDKLNVTCWKHCQVLPDLVVIAWS